MKKLFTIVLSAGVFIANAQWTDITNNFEDSMHMPVSTAPLFQKNPLVLTSYPDNGYFVIWEDDRNNPNTKTDIYAQKYDNAGNRLWAEGGILLCTGPNNQHYTWSSNQDYRNRNFLATDSAGGFYICYADDSVSNYTWERVMVQHVRSNGTLVFPNPGYRIATSTSANGPVMAQMIPDGNKGFFISYKTTLGFTDYISVYCYRDEGGTLAFYGGGRVNENANQISSLGACGIRTTVEYPLTTVSEYAIWSDNDGGCNVIMSMSGNAAGQQSMLTYNRVWRAKKDSKARTLFRNVAATACPRYTDYKKGDVYVMYKLKTDFQNVACGGGGSAFGYTNYRLTGLGYLLIDNNGYTYDRPKGVNVKGGIGANINVDLLATVKTTINNNVVSKPIVYGLVFPSEKFDSIPYQNTTYDNPDVGYNPNKPQGMNAINLLRDTILGIGDFLPDFTLAAADTLDIYATGLMGTNGNRLVRLQHLEVKRESPDSFSVEYGSSSFNPSGKLGTAIGGETNQGPTIGFDLPRVIIHKRSRNPFFLINEYGRGPRISPITRGDIDLRWGAMGRLISTGYYSGYYNLEHPVFTLDSSGTAGLMVWRDNKLLNGASTQDNIFMRHIDRLADFNYMPPYKKVKPLYPSSAEMIANPVFFTGTTRKYSVIESLNGNNNVGTSPVADILDWFYLGRVQFHSYQRSLVQPIRKYNNEAYLSRNYTIKTDSVPPQPGQPIGLNFFFTTEEFNQLKATSNLIADPVHLTVVRQPNTSATAPETYTPVAGEELTAPLNYDTVDGGFRIQVWVHGTGNFFFRKITTTSICSAAAASFTSNLTGAKYQWQVNTGLDFTNISNNTNYSGATTQTLQLTNIPSSFNSYRYRCLVDVDYSNTFYLQLANIWTGAVNNQWETAGNWSCNKVPDANTDVIINSGTVTINSAGATCRSININPTANVSVAAGFKLTVTH